MKYDFLCVNLGTICTFPTGTEGILTGKRDVMHNNHSSADVVTRGLDDLLASPEGSAYQFYVGEVRLNGSHTPLGEVPTGSM